MRGAATMLWIADSIAEQLSRESCSSMRSEMHYTAAVRRISKSAHCMRRPPYEGSPNAEGPQRKGRMD
eukprot:1163956-Lingulodinium_polyedra.AAC.1